MKLKTAVGTLALLAMSATFALAVTFTFVGRCDDKTHAFNGQKFEKMKDCRAAASAHKSETHKGGAKVVTCVKL